MRNFQAMPFFVLCALSVAVSGCGSDDVAASAEEAQDAATDNDVGGVDAADVSSGEDVLDATAEDVAAADITPDTKPDIIDSDAPFKTAAHYGLPQLIYGGVDVLHKPHIVTVTFASDPYADEVEKFGAQLQTTKWWDAWAGDYCSSPGKCVGKGDADKVRLGSTAAKSYTDTTTAGAASTIQQFITTHIDSAELPAPVTDTIYMIYFPQGTSITLSSGGQPAKSCQAFGGYHHSLTYKGMKVAYAIIPECKGGGSGMNQLDSMLLAASHEVSEAVTDPYDTGSTTSSPYGGYNINVMDMNVLAWVFALGGGEVADLCPDLPYPGFGHAEENGYKLARVWSNSAAKANHDPCVPAAPGPYFNVAPEKNKGTHVALEPGETKTILLHAFSDKPVQPWTVTAVDIDSFQGGGTPLTFDFDGKDSATVNNGDVINLNITRDTFAQPASPYGAIAYLVSTSADGNQTFMWPIWSHTQKELTGK